MRREINDVGRFKVGREVGPVGTIMKEIRFSFLAAGPGFVFQVPSDFDSIPELSSPLRNGNGARSFDFVPSHRDVSPASDVTPIGTLEGRDGRRVELFEEPETPQWFLRWPISNGALYSHLREEDGLEMAPVVADSLSIVEDPHGGTPFLLPEPPLNLAISSRVGYQEWMSLFASARGSGWNVSFRRPSFLAEGIVVTVPTYDTGGQVVLRAGARDGIEVSVIAETDLQAGQELMSVVVGTLSMQ